MKKIVIVIFAIAFSIPAMNAQKAMDIFEVQVDGLGCPFCAYGLEKKFKEFKGIKKVKIDIETGDFSFHYPAEKSLTLEAVESQVVKAGYTPNDAKVTRADGTTESLDKDIAALDDTAELIKTSTFVAGNCGMCKARIDKAVQGIAGVAMAALNVDTKMLQVEFAEGQTSLDAIEKVVASVGHDTKNHKANENTYDGLPGCCQYERVNQ